MTSITEAQRVALERAVEALWDRWNDESYFVVNDLLDHATIEAEETQTPDTPALWRDSDREDWMSDGSIHLELVAAPYLTGGHWRGGTVLIDDDGETVAVEPEHLPALIAMLQEVQHRIGGEAK